MNSRRTIDAPLEQLDLATVLRVSQAVSCEIVLEKLIDTLLRIAIEYGRAERALLLLPKGTELRVQAEAVTAAGSVTIRLCDAPIVSDQLPASVVQYAARSQESVILENAAAPSNFANDEYVHKRQARSILCLPLVTQGRLIAILYLENSLVANAFDPRRIAVLNRLASAAAISLENSRLYRGLQEREAKVRRLVEANIIGIFIGNLAGQILEANDAFLRIVGYDREDLVSGRLRWTDLTPPEWLEQDERRTWDLKMSGGFQPYEKEYSRKDGSRVPVLMGGALFEEGGTEGVAFVLDLTERKRAEQAVRQLESDLAHINRVTMMGELSASLAHELKQPIAAARNNARAAQNFLNMQPPNLNEVREAVGCVVGDVDRAGEIIDRIADQIKKAPLRKDQFDLNAAIREVIGLARSITTKGGVSVETRLADGVLPVQGDRVQLEQVVLNLILNAVEAMGSVETEARELRVSTEQDRSGVLVAVGDSGPGVDTEHLERVFQPFYTTKPGGMGMGLSVCRSIIDAHGGRLWADANEPRGAVFRFTLPRREGSS